MPLRTFSLVFFLTCTRVHSISNPPHCFSRSSISPSKSNQVLVFDHAPLHVPFQFSISVYFVECLFLPRLSLVSLDLSVYFFFVQSLGFCMNVASSLSFYSHPHHIYPTTTRASRSSTSPPMWVPFDLVLERILEKTSYIGFPN